MFWNTTSGKTGVMMRLGIDFGGTNVKFGVFDDNALEVLFCQKKLSDFTGQGQLLDNLIAFTKSIIKDHPVKAGGLGIKGLVDPHSGIVHNDIGAGNLLVGKDLRKAFENALNIPFIVDNDARAYAWGEWKFGAGKSSNPMVCLTLGTGIGSALIVNGKPYEGIDPSSALLGGHISIDRNGPPCPCGSRGCLESYCSATAFNQRVKAAHLELGDLAEPLPVFFKELRKGNTEYQPTLDAFLKDLALGIVNLVHAYGPETVVLGGGVMNSADMILPGLIEMVHGMAWTHPRRSVEIKAAVLGNRAAAIGMAFHPLLK
jgi:glucokinase